MMKENSEMINGGISMKKLTVVLLLLAVLLSLAACAPSGASNPIDFGKKYMLNEARYYVFNADQTGYSEYYLKTRLATYSGRVEFVWREAADGAVYLFRTETVYNDDHTEGESIPLIDDPIYFGEDFFVYSYSTEAGGTSVRYVKEGSELAEALGD
jgi:hypothetical protein